MQGNFSGNFSLTVVFATVFSIIMAFTLTPMLAAIILPEHDRKKHPIGHALERMFILWEKIYQGILAFIIKSKVRSLIVLLLTFILFVFGMRLGGTIGFEFTPNMDEGLLSVSVELPSGYKLDETAEVLNTIGERVQQYKEVSHYWTQLGRATEMDRGVNLAVLKVKLVGKHERELQSNEFANLLVRDLSDIPNAEIRVSSISSITSGRQDVEFSLVGQDMDTLVGIEKQLYPRIKEVPGVIT